MEESSCQGGPWGLRLTLCEMGQQQPLGNRRVRAGMAGGVSGPAGDTRGSGPGGEGAIRGTQFQCGRSNGLGQQPAQQGHGAALCAQVRSSSHQLSARLQVEGGGWRRWVGFPDQLLSKSSLLPWGLACGP